MRESSHQNDTSLVRGRPAWYVVRTKRYREQLAHAQLGQRAITSYLPMVVEWPRPVVGSEIQPLFPGYLFVQAERPEDFSQIAWCQGVQDFVRVAGTPGSLGDAAIDFLRGQEGPDGLIRHRLTPPEKTFVRVSEGPFRGLTAMLERRLPARHRVLVLLHFLQRETPVELPERWVKRA